MEHVVWDTPTLDDDDDDDDGVPVVVFHPRDYCVNFWDTSTSRAWVWHQHTLFIIIFFFFTRFFIRRVIWDASAVFDGVLRDRTMNKSR